jgi:hypothetical protein
VHAEQPVAANPLAAFIKFAPATTYRAEMSDDYDNSPSR